MADARRGAAGDLTRGRLVDGNVAPAQQPLPVGGERLLDQLLELGPAGVVLGEEEDADGEAPLARDGEVLAVRDLAQELGGQLEQDSRAVAGRAVGSGGTAMLEVDQRRQRALDELMRPPPVGAADESDAAGIARAGRVVDEPGPGVGDVAELPGQFLQWVCGFRRP